MCINFVQYYTTSNLNLNWCLDASGMYGLINSTTSCPSYTSFIANNNYAFTINPF